MTPTASPRGQETLRDALRLAGDDLRAHQPDPRVPHAVWAAMAAAKSAAPARRRSSWLAWIGGGLAFATLAVAALMLAVTPLPQDDLVGRRASVSTPFLPVSGGERWPQLLREAREQGPAWVVPAELPRESLAAMGLPYDPARAGEPVRAELLVHASGDVLAVRFVR
ncbi:hypothetical protein [Piscinibacter sp. XHJ-5]|uniref:hypothetical protein n=1 Tax=Piscinibacter sp. XHJ-5 TaxID=3037797 RepID=UPI00245357A3|nr:hypothetical protein [Piscinibacter sp. XHJ-5]